VIRSIVEEKMDIQGGYAKPKVWDVLLIQLVILPYTIYLWTLFYSRWLWKFGIRREEYGEDEKLYVIRRNMKLSEGQFNVSMILIEIFKATYDKVNLNIISTDHEYLITVYHSNRLLPKRNEKTFWNKSCGLGKILT